ncbi:MAG: phosphoribosyltransferase [Thermoanaerobaculia bacterium]
MRFRDRRDAGRRLAPLLKDYAGREDVVVLALPRGGVPVGYEIARSLGVRLEVFLVRKLGVPGQEELAMGAIASGAVRVLSSDLVAALGISAEMIESVARREEAELTRREKAYRGDREPVQIEGKVTVLVDDGLATGSSMRAAVRAVRKLAPSRIVVAVPVGAPSTCSDLREEADEVVCAYTPEPFQAVGLWYEDFTQTTDAEVRELLDGSRTASAG